MVRWRQQGGVGHVVAQAVGDDGLHLGDHVAGGGRQLGVGPGLDETGSDCEGFDLGLVEHQRREVGAGLRT